MGEDQWSGIVSTAIRVALFVLYSYHLYRTFKLHQHEHSPRSLRNMEIAIGIWAGVVGLLAGSAYRAEIIPLDVAIGIGYVAAGMLLIVGMHAFFLWRVDKS